MNKDTLQKVLELHKLWIDNGFSVHKDFHADLSGSNLFGVDLSGLDLRRSELSGANLYKADMSKSDLRRAYLNEANLYKANLRGANLVRADLTGANLCDADLHGADLRDADLRGADLSGANLGGADLRGADLSEANLYGANLYGADLNGANLREADPSSAYLCEARNVPYIPGSCPDEGAFTAWKAVKAGGAVYILKLLIPADARRSSATGRKCRAEYVETLDIFKRGTDEHCTRICNPAYCRAGYVVGQKTYADSWTEDRWRECAHGIHFFMTRQEAEAYYD